MTSNVFISHNLMFYASIKCLDGWVCKSADAIVSDCQRQMKRPPQHVKIIIKMNKSD